MSVVESVVSWKHGLLPSSHTMDGTLRDFSIEVAVEGLAFTITNSQNKETTSHYLKIFRGRLPEISEI